MGTALRVSGGYPVFRLIHQTFQSAFWDSLVNNLLLAMQCYVRVLHVVGEIRGCIHNLIIPLDSCNIMEAVDLNFIRDQVEKGLY